jgi:hypothetical protein
MQFETDNHTVAGTAHQIQSRIETMYMDKLDGRITQEFFDRTSAARRDEQQVLCGRS